MKTHSLQSISRRSCSFQRLEVKGWFGWDMRPFCSAFSSEFVCEKLLRDTGNRWLTCAGVPRTLGSARRREQGLGWKGERSPSPLKREAWGPFPSPALQALELGSIRRSSRDHKSSKTPVGRVGVGALPPSIPAIGD